MKKNPAFRLRVMQSKYFNPAGHESVATVVHDFADPFTMPSMYTHLQRHQESDIQKARKRFKEIDHPHNVPLAKVAGAVEGEVLSTQQHELGLDEFIREGREKLLRKEMTISASNYLEAIKIKAGIEKNTKDRRMDMIKSFFATPKKEEPQA